MIGAQSNSMGMDARGPEPMTEDKFGGPETQITLGAESVFGSNAEECVASGAGSIHPSLEGTTCSGTRSGAIAGAMFRILSDCRPKSCTSCFFDAPYTGLNPSKIKSPRMLTVYFGFPNLT